MKTDFDVSKEYAKERSQPDAKKWFWIGLVLMIIAAALDWGLFQWIYFSTHSH